MSLPIVCIVGIATSTEILHQSLSKSTIGLLRIERFKLENSEVWFNRVIEKVNLNKCSSDTYVLLLVIRYFLIPQTH